MRRHTPAAASAVTRLACAATRRRAADAHTQCAAGGLGQRERCQPRAVQAVNRISEPEALAQKLRPLEWHVQGRRRWAGGDRGPLHDGVSTRRHCASVFAKDGFEHIVYSFIHGRWMARLNRSRPFVGTHPKEHQRAGGEARSRAASPSNADQTQGNDRLRP